MTTTSQSLNSFDTSISPLAEIETHSSHAWDEKMAELEAIHREIAPQVNAMREALEENDVENVLSEFDLAYFLRGQKRGEKHAVRCI